MTLHDDYLLFLDLETTGTNPETDVVLEVATVLVDAKTLEVMFQNTDLVRVEDDLNDLMTPFVKDMHTKNGLLKDLTEFENSQDTLESVLRQTLCDVQFWFVENKIRECSYAEFYGTQWIRLAGYSPQFDRQFIERDAPAFAKLLSHRMMDVSTLRSAAKAWAPHLVKDQEKAHRALDDCFEALEELRTYRKVFEGSTKTQLDVYLTT